jgi:hypothetical protein
MIAVCTGDLVKQTCGPTIQIHYSVESPINASSIVISIAPFEMMRIPVSQNKKSNKG